MTNDTIILTLSGLIALSLAEKGKDVALVITEKDPVSNARTGQEIANYLTLGAPKVRILFPGKHSEDDSGHLKDILVCTGYLLNKKINSLPVGTSGHVFEISIATN